MVSRLFGKKPASRPSPYASTSSSLASSGFSAGGGCAEGGWLEDCHRRAPYIPLRLTDTERAQLLIIQGALDVSEYTENVDVSQNDFYARQRYDSYARINDQVDEMLSCMLGLHAANGHRGTASLVAQPKRDSADFFRSCLEVGRRYKIMNPDKMRTTYGKLLYMLMDACKPKVRRRLEIDLRKPVLTVASAVGEHGIAKLLGDPLLEIAAKEVVLGRDVDLGEGSEYIETTRRRLLSEMARAKSDAIAALCHKYANAELSIARVEQIVHSVTDHYSFLRDNRGPVESMLLYLNTMFPPNKPETREYSLGIKHGSGGSKLTHAHKTQFQFVRQTLTLWRNIMDRFFELWLLAEEDLLSSGYQLANTGQGLQRCQGAPRVARAMAEIVGNTRHEVGGWVGLSVVHLGDRDVPNALVFVDKYTQIRRILAPIVSTLDQLGKMESDPHLLKYVQTTFGGVQRLRKTILVDFFKHGFDGSGDDGGSCIDGRLTSCWNWCSKLERKAFYPAFLLTGFLGFDGDFR